MIANFVSVNPILEFFAKKEINIIHNRNEIENIQHILISHDNAISRPPPNATPSIAAIVGIGRF